MLQAIVFIVFLVGILWLVTKADLDGSKSSSAGTVTVEDGIEGWEDVGGSESPYEPRPTAERTYRLESFEASPGSRGYVAVRNEDGQNLSWRRLPKSDGLHAVGVAGESFHMEDLQSDTFESGWIAKKVDAGEAWRCRSMWEVVDGGERKSLRVLLVGPDASVELRG